MSLSMSPLPSLPPPLNSMCSTQWVEPVMPGTSLREPIRYTTHVDSAFVSGIGRRTTFRPFSNVSTWVDIHGRKTGARYRVARSRTWVVSPLRRRRVGGCIASNAKTQLFQDAPFVQDSNLSAEPLPES